jgi:peptide/nickel transport system permease protein
MSSDVTFPTGPAGPPGAGSGSGSGSGSTGPSGSGVTDARARAIAEIRTQRRERRRLLLGKPSFIVGMLMLGFWTLCSVMPGAIAPRDPDEQDLIGKLKGPTAKHWFGTDGLGRDVFSRIIVGARVILFVAFGATLIAAILGTALGLVAGYSKGIVDEVLMRIADVFMAIPTVVLALLITSSVESKSMLIVMFIIAAVFTPIIARTVRAAVLGESELDYVAAARLRTEKTPHILFVEVLPNVLPSLMVEFTVRLGYAIFAIATLSFLGAGAGPDSTDWGTQVATHYKFLNGLNWSATVFPALAIASLAIAVNLVQDALTEAFER